MSLVGQEGDSLATTTTIPAAALAADPHEAIGDLAEAAIREDRGLSDWESTPDGLYFRLPGGAEIDLARFNGGYRASLLLSSIFPAASQTQAKDYAVARIFAELQRALRYLQARLTA